jgi:hypothetical protein
MQSTIQDFQNRLDQAEEWILILEDQFSEVTLSNKQRKTENNEGNKKKKKMKKAYEIYRT